MQKIELTNEIKEKHKEYYSKKVLELIKENNKKIKFYAEDIEEFYSKSNLIPVKRNYTMKQIKDEHKAFIEYFILNWEKIIVGNTTVLNDSYINMVNDFKIVNYLLENNFKFSKKNKNQYCKGKYYSNVLIDLFGYNDFSESNFFEIIKEEAKKRKNKKYCKDVQGEVVKILLGLYGDKEQQILKEFSDELKESDLKKKFEKFEKENKLGLTLNSYNKEIFKNSWNAYIFCLSLNIRTCPYCNKQFIAPIVTSSGSMRGDLDHFLPKSIFPYFSMSIYNLVPACKFCNSSLKGSNEFNFDDINPYNESFDTYAEFYADINYDTPIRIQIKPRTGQQRFKDKISRLNDTFKLELQYNYHTNQVKELIHKRLAYSEERINDIKSGTFKDSVSEKKLKEVLIGYTEDQLRINDEPLSKFRRDIVKELKFFEYVDKELINDLRKIINDDK